MEKIERVDTHEDDPERRKDEADIIGKMMNMIGSLREELGNLWTRNSVLEKELAVLRPRENAVCDTPSIQGEQPLLRGDQEDGENPQQPSAYEGDGGKAVESINDVCPEVEKDKSCCCKSTCEKQD